MSCMPDGRGLHVENDTARTPLPLISLAAADVGRHASVTANVQLTFGNRPVDLEITLPADSVSATDLLPIYQGLTNLVVDIGVEAVEHRGEAVSCRKGCGACCRQPVPISETEARAVAQLVENLPEPRRSIVRERFVGARNRLAAAGLLEAFSHPERVTGTDAMSNSARYFNLGIACPFLEEESCSIHPDRPLACREYLVTSPAENCARPAESELRPVPLPARVAAAVRAGDRPTPDGVGWVLLALAPDWAATHPEPPPRPGPELFQEFFDRLLPRTDWVQAPGTGPRSSEQSPRPTKRRIAGMMSFSPRRNLLVSSWRDPWMPDGSASGPRCRTMSPRRSGWRQRFASSIDCGKMSAARPENGFVRGWRVRQHARDH
jgi:Fe-S-cluster containining protein